MAFSLPPIFVSIRGVDEFSKVANATAGEVKKFSSSMQQVGSTLTVGLTLPIVAMGVSTLRTAGNFEQSMNKVGVVSRATGEEISQMSTLARELGATTQFTASEAADGMSFLAMAGFDASQVIGAMPGVLDLAAAGEMDLARAADIASNILTGYGLEAGKITDVNDMMTATFTRTNTNLEQLGEAMKFVAPVASAMKIPISETSAALGLLGNAGIQASMAGTTLRGILSKIATPSGEAVKILQRLGISKSQVIDSSGNVKGLVQLVKILEESGASASDMLEIFGERAGPGMAALVQRGSKALKELSATVEDAAGKGGTADVARARMKGFNGAMRALKSAIEVLQMAIADSGLLDFMTKLVLHLAEFFRSLSKTNPILFRLGTILAVIAAAIGPLLVLLGSLGGLLAGVVALFASPIFIGAMGFLGAGLAKGLALALSPLGLMIAAFFVWAHVINLIRKNWDDLVDVFTDFKLFVETMKFFLADLLGPVARFVGLGEYAASGGKAGGGGSALKEIVTAGSTTSHSVVDVNVKSNGPGVRADVMKGDVNLMTELGLLPSY